MNCPSIAERLTPRRHRRSCRASLGIAALLLAGVSVPALAHDPRPVYAEILTETTGATLLRWKTPNSVAFDAQPLLTLSGPCSALGERRAEIRSDGWVSRQRYACSPSAAGALFEIRFPDTNPSLSTLVHYESGETPQQVLLQPGQYRWEIPAIVQRAQLRADYFRLGVAHIWSGYDHLLFLACLLAISGTLRRTALAVTGFTLAHSLTLAAAALGYTRVPLALVEALIALSIAFLAAEYLRGRTDTLTWRYPGTVAAVFGLLHGFGFASALSGLGLPAGSVVSALLFFNVGVETGQLVFIVGLGVLIAALRWFAASTSILVCKDIPYARLAVASVGCVAGYWTIERVAGF